MSVNAVPQTPRVAAAQLKGGAQRQSRVLRGLFYLVLVVIAFYMLFPFYWAIRSALTKDSDLFVTPVQYIPNNPTLENFGNALTGGVLKPALINSAVVAASVTLLSLVIGASAAYALGRLQFRGRTVMMYVILSMTIFPQIAILGALYTMFSDFGIINTSWSLIISYLIFTLPFTVWVLQSFSAPCRRSSRSRHMWMAHRHSGRSGLSCCLSLLRAWSPLGYWPSSTPGMSTSTRCRSCRHPTTTQCRLRSLRGHLPANTTIRGARSWPEPWW